MLDKLHSIFERYVYIEEQLSNPEVVQDMKNYMKLNKEYKDLKEVVTVYLKKSKNR